MAYETISLQRHDTYAIYTIHGTDEAKAALLSADDPTAVVTQILATGGAPAPNQVIVHQPSSSTDSIQDDIEKILKDITTGGGGGGGSSHPPLAVVYHQESGDHISRYITIIIPV